jgi:putative colanic acid biosynthesis acetyltransferase WcaF
MGTEAMNVDLSLTTNRDYLPGRSLIVRVLWLFVEAVVLLNPLVTSYRLKRAALRIFGAHIGANAIVKPGVHIKYPWRLRVGDNCWLGERCWIDNMEDVTLGNNVVVSQGAYLCTGNHDWSDPGMGLTPQPIVVEDGAWIGAYARVAPGRRIAKESILVIGAVSLADTAPRGIYAGNPAELVRWRTVRDTPGPLLESKVAVGA